ncbi:MAG: outer membrane protein assembly factor BamD [Planctomycetota bacterium]|nr:outer membrane protein assembly factor BamD [Planctomycetota bacterium]
MRHAAPIALVALLSLAGLAHAQTTTYTLDDGRGWVETANPEPGSDEDVIGRARRALAEGRASRAKSLLDDWIENNEFSKSPMLPEAYLRRGDARVALGREDRALYDYEQVIKEYPGTEQFVIALERELEIGLRYLSGLRRRLWGTFRIEDATSIGEELLLRVQERLPGSRLAERAAIELADYYYRERELRLAADAYDIFVVNYPKSEYLQKAMQRRVFANIARFKGPKYDAGGLLEAQILIRDFAAKYPAQAEETGMNDALVARLDESAAAQMLETARWYFKRKDPVSARLLLTRLVRKHPQTIASGDAIRIMQERGWMAGPASATPTPPADAATATPGPTPEAK